MNTATDNTEVNGRACVPRKLLSMAQKFEFHTIVCGEVFIF